MRGKVATPRVGLCVLLLLLALLVSINIGLTLWLLFTVRLDLVSSCFTLFWKPTMAANDSTLFIRVVEVLSLSCQEGSR